MRTVFIVTAFCQSPRSDGNFESHFNSLDYTGVVMAVDKTHALGVRDPGSNERHQCV